MNMRQQKSMTIKYELLKGEKIITEIFTIMTCFQKEKISPYLATTTYKNAKLYSMAQ